MCLKLLAPAIVLLSLFHSDTAERILRNKTTFTDLNGDVQLLIIEELDLPDLIHFADTSQLCSLVGAEVFRRKFANNLVRIVNAFFPLMGNNNITSDNIRVTNSKIEIQHFDATLMVLKHFGHAISKLGFSVACTTMHVAECMSKIQSYISEYCSDELTEFHVASFHVDFFKKFTKPFKKVEGVYIGRSFGSFDSDTFPFEELFPAMRRLHLSMIVTADGNSIARKYPKLEELSVAIGNGAKSLREEHITALLQKNPNIRSAKFKGCSRPFLENVNKVIPTLDELEIEEYAGKSEGEPTIVFNYVKYFSIISWNSAFIPQNLHFPNLVEFSINANNKLGTGWSSMIHRLAQNSKNFTKLTVSKRNYARVFLSDGIMRQLSEQRMNLTEVHFTLDEDVKDESVVNFIEVNDKLRKVHLIRYIPLNSFEGLIKTIGTKYGGKWEIIRTDLKYGIILKRMGF